MPIEWNERGEPQPFNQGVSLSDLTPAQVEFMDKEMSKSYASQGGNQNLAEIWPIARNGRETLGPWARLRI